MIALVAAIIAAVILMLVVDAEVEQRAAERPFDFDRRGIDNTPIGVLGRRDGDHQ